MGACVKGGGEGGRGVVWEGAFSIVVGRICTVPSVCVQVWVYTHMDAGSASASVCLCARVKRSKNLVCTHQVPEILMNQSQHRDAVMVGFDIALLLASDVIEPLLVPLHCTHTNAHVHAHTHTHSRTQTHTHACMHG
jgi:hypothetical protein